MTQSEVAMRGKTIAMVAGIALLVVVSYDAYKAKRS